MAYWYAFQRPPLSPRSNRLPTLSLCTAALSGLVTPVHGPRPTTAGFPLLRVGRTFGSRSYGTCSNTPRMSPSSAKPTIQVNGADQVSRNAQRPQSMQQCSSASPPIADIWPRQGVRRHRSGDAASPKERSGYVLQDGLGNAGGYADCEGDVEETRSRGNIILRMAQAEVSAAGRSDRQGPERNASIGSSRRLTAADAARDRRSPSTSLAASRSRAGRGRSAGRASRQRSCPHTRSESGW